jgi:hypothetical protein
MLDVNAKQSLQQANLIAIPGTREGVENRYCLRCRAHDINDKNEISGPLDCCDQTPH